MDFQLFTAVLEDRCPRGYRREDRDAVVTDPSEVETVATKAGEPIFYTVGQGARIPGEAKKWFVVDRDGQTVTVADDTNHPALYVDEVRDWSGREVGKRRLLIRL